jgi:hypothetical protein
MDCGGWGTKYGTRCSEMSGILDLSEGAQVEKEGGNGDRLA